MTETPRPSRPDGLRGRPPWWLALMLLTLHASLAWGVQPWWARALLLAHLGFFLLWQPVWRTDQPVGPASGVALALLAALLVLGAGWWTAALWIGVLVGLIGGRAFGIEHRRTRLAALLAVTYLLGMLLGWVVPHLFAAQPVPPPVTALIRFGLPVFPLLLLLLGRDAAASEKPHVVDFIYSLMLFLLVLVLVLGSFALQVISGEHYLLALAGALIALAGLLLVLAWLWQPRAGFAGFGQLLSRYLLSVGLPFEDWLRNLARLAESEREPEAFLRRAMGEIEKLPWVSGGTWRTPEAKGEFGLPTAYCLEISLRRLALDLYTRTHPAPALVMHTRLLVELIEFFYEAKLREQQQRQNAYMQAIHETGARLTHDVKNLLQSLTTLCSAAESSGTDQAEALQALMRRQLPLITTRLDQTLKKLRAPHLVGKEEAPARQWWAALMTRYEDENIEFEAEGEPDDTPIPVDLFDSVADNLLQNALKKRAQQKDILIRVRFAAGPRRAFTVCDTGRPMSQETAARLINAPVVSTTGFGIGLYQAARQAEALGYQLRLLHNEVGRVCFELRPALRLVVANENTPPAS
ncbi:sensor histidine kinase [Thiobacter aerophilum]|uniref:ATP-binding protein n=1 Tax=Thiobacter aerophilum TaxID=3121275 RepID=A0ABV0EC95_9BURK